MRYDATVTVPSISFDGGGLLWLYLLYQAFALVIPNRVLI